MRLLAPGLPDFGRISLEVSDIRRRRGRCAGNWWTRPSNQTAMLKSIHRRISENDVSCIPVREDVTVNFKF